MSEEGMELAAARPGRRRRSTQTKTILIALAAAAALAAPAAQAVVPDVTVRSATVAGGQGTASCGPGEVALGGGASAADPAGAYVGRDEPEPKAGTPTGWSAWLRNRADGGPAAGTVYAVCARSVAATVRSAYFDVGGDAAASCQAGEVATGGGTGADNFLTTYVARSQPEPATGSPSGWRGWLRNRADGSFGTGTVYVVCAQALTLAVRSATFSGGEGTAACLPGEVATGGGVGIAIPENAYVARSQPEPASGVPGGWHATVRARTDGTPSSGTVYAVCARDTDAPETTITSGPAEGETVGDVPPTFEFASSEPGSRFECRTYDPDDASSAGRNFAPCASPHTRTDLIAQIALGERSVFEVRAIDAAGNVDPVPATRGYVKHGDPEKPPVLTKCEPVAVDAEHGKLIEANCRLTEIRNGKVACVNLETLKKAQCRFKRSSGSWLTSTEGDRFAVVGQSINRRGKRKGKFVVAAPIGDKRRSPCADDSSARSGRARDTSGTPYGTELATSCVVEILDTQWNATGIPLQNYATREVCTGTYPHPDGAQLVSTPEPGVYCYSGYGAGLNDVNGTERDAFGVYLPPPNYCHVVWTNGVEVPGAKRPGTRSFPWPGYVQPRSALVWRPVASSVPIANQ